MKKLIIIRNRAISILQLVALPVGFYTLGIWLGFSVIAACVLGAMGFLLRVWAMRMTSNFLSTLKTLMSEHNNLKKDYGALKDENENLKEKVEGNQTALEKLEIINATLIKSCNTVESIDSHLPKIKQLIVTLKQAKQDAETELSFLRGACEVMDEKCAGLLFTVLAKPAVRDSLKALDSNECRSNIATAKTFLESELQGGLLSVQDHEKVTGVVFRKLEINKGL